ncbi:hypothetical protein P7K49_033504 [Saguinus oedipus]|uniref:Uncharacterized protein n=1 Tax=Saguinus oedipus TaxID=9490 RepID=A0ABQ9TS48_SAGOE|nr:hypothetical protein P7K49_033504 [Saguinus oedipus]
MVQTQQAGYVAAPGFDLDPHEQYRELPPTPPSRLVEGEVRVSGAISLPLLSGGPEPGSHTHWTQPRHFPLAHQILHGAFGNEEQQLAWAKRESEKAEQERLARLRRQEQEDLELAIALSKADMPAA